MQITGSIKYTYMVYIYEDLGIFTNLYISLVINTITMLGLPVKGLSSHLHFRSLISFTHTLWLSRTRSCTYFFRLTF